MLINKVIALGVVLVLLLVMYLVFSSGKTGATFNVQVVDRETEDPLDCARLIVFSVEYEERHVFEADEEGFVPARLTDGVYHVQLTGQPRFKLLAGEPPPTS